MASSSTDILSSLGLTADSPLETILEKLINYNLVTTDEIHNIKNISVLPLPNIVRNQADILKERMYGIATNEDYGIPVVINRRMVLIRYILDKLNIKIEELIEELTNGSFVVKKAKQDSEGNDIVETYETKSDSTTKNTIITNRVSDLEEGLEDGTFVVEKSKRDANGNQIDTTYETKTNASTERKTISDNLSKLDSDLTTGAKKVGKAISDENGYNISSTYETKSNASTTTTTLENKINTSEANSKKYTDSEFTRLYNLILGDSETLQGTYDTFKEIAGYIASDKTGAAEMLSSINNNSSEINSLKSTKEDKSKLKALAYKDSLSKSDVGLGNVRNVETYSKTEINEELSDIREAIDTLSGVSGETQVQLQNYYTKTETVEKINDTLNGYNVIEENPINLKEGKWQFVNNTQDKTSGQSQTSCKYKDNSGKSYNYFTIVYSSGGVYKIYNSYTPTSSALVYDSANPTDISLIFESENTSVLDFLNKVAQKSVKEFYNANDIKSKFRIFLHNVSISSQMGEVDGVNVYTPNFKLEFESTSPTPITSWEALENSISYSSPAKSITDFFIGTIYNDPFGYLMLTGIWIDSLTKNITTYSDDSYKIKYFDEYPRISDSVRLING